MLAGKQQFFLQHEQIFIQIDHVLLQALNLLVQGLELGRRRIGRRRGRRIGGRPGLRIGRPRPAVSATGGTCAGGGVWPTAKPGGQQHGAGREGENSMLEIHN